MSDEMRDKSQTTPTHLSCGSGSHEPAVGAAARKGGARCGAGKVRARKSQARGVGARARGARAAEGAAGEHESL
jgi:hypothetical protein